MSMTRIVWRNVWRRCGRPGYSEGKRSAFRVWRDAMRVKLERVGNYYRNAKLAAERA